MGLGLLERSYMIMNVFMIRIRDYFFINTFDFSNGYECHEQSLISACSISATRSK